MVGAGLAGTLIRLAAAALLFVLLGCGLGSEPGTFEVHFRMLEIDARERKVVGERLLGAPASRRWNSRTTPHLQDLQMRLRKGSRRGGRQSLA